MLSCIFTSLKLKPSKYTHSYFYLHFRKTSSKAVSQARVVAGSRLAEVGWREGSSVGSWTPLRSSPQGSLQASFGTTPTCYHHPVEKQSGEDVTIHRKEPSNCKFIDALKINITLITISMPTTGNNSHCVDRHFSTRKKRQSKRRLWWSTYLSKAHMAFRHYMRNLTLPYTHKHNINI